MGANNLKCPLDHSEWACIEHNNQTQIAKDLPKPIYDGIRKIAKNKGISVKLYMEICMRRIIEQDKEWLK